MKTAQRTLSLCMKSHVHQRGFTPVQAFRFEFQRRLTEYRQRYGSVAEAFGVSWEETLAEVPVDNITQGELYRELLNWARNPELFTPGSLSRQSAVKVFAPRVPTGKALRSSKSRNLSKPRTVNPPGLFPALVVQARSPS